ncbi:2-nitropropane dioxygenase [Diplodia corticola]|uniref:2-nitropropane dioxygenase n=1 Tax=Diplodia corticola TaxID=236234 RepID=A0A1J9S1U3_9PEZI|nr:2-nitropropane dioxygenase [Diplodia corticola]OJD33988.1 2-nitropropane dioxygenase [Diplodia corticola]
MASPILHLQKSYPWTRAPLIANAPMAGSAGPRLAAAVTNAGGLGFIGGGVDMAQLAADLDACRNLVDIDVDRLLATTETTDQTTTSTLLPLLPIGIGILCFNNNNNNANNATAGEPLVPPAALADVVRAHRPAAVWLFAAASAAAAGAAVDASSASPVADYTPWARAVRAACPQTAVWVQVGSVAAAVAAAGAGAADVLVLQGADAGGHGFERGAGWGALVPEVVDALGELPGVGIVAAGGIVEARGAAGALAVGAGGVVMGTRFLACEEVACPAFWTERVLRASDGGVATARSKAFDEARAGGNVWPGGYDGRALVNRTYRDFVAGEVPVEEIRRLHGEEQKRGDAGCGGTEDMRVTVWAGTGVGLVREVLPAGKIVEDVREGARRVLKNLGAQL